MCSFKSPDKIQYLSVRAERLNYYCWHYCLPWYYFGCKQELNIFLRFLFFYFKNNCLMAFSRFMIQLSCSIIGIRIHCMYNLCNGRYSFFIKHWQVLGIKYYESYIFIYFIIKCINTRDNCDHIFIIVTYYTYTYKIYI